MVPLGPSYHWYEIGGWPSTWTLSVTVWPDRTIWLTGCVSISGSVGGASGARAKSRVPVIDPLVTDTRVPVPSTVEQSLAGLGRGITAEMGVQVPDALVTDCVRRCCSLCLLENDPSVIEPDVLSKDRDKFESTGDQKYVDKAHRRGKVGWNVGRHIEVIPHYRRPHMALVWTGRGRAVPKIVPRRGSVVHRSVVEKVPSGWEAQ